MRSLIWPLVAVVLAMPAVSVCCTVTVGDGENLTGTEVATVIDFFGGDLGLGSDWTLCIAPGTYLLDPSDEWPVVLTMYCPEIVGPGGAEATVLIGHGLASAFEIHGEVPVRLSGLTFRNFGEPVTRESVGWTTVRLTDSVIEYCDVGFDAQAATAGEVSRNIIRHNNGAGLYIYHNFTIIEDNEIHHNGYGISSPCCEEPTIRGNHIHDNDDYGLATAFGGNAVEYNLIEDNGGAGISAYGVGPNIKHNVIRGNATGVAVVEMTSVRINRNDLYGNATYEVEVLWPNGGTIDATMNWWGTTDPSVIASRIYDCLDDPGLLTRVEFDPWCDEPGCEGSTAVEEASWGSIKALFRD